MKPSWRNVRVLTVVLLSLILMLALAACSKSDNNTKEPTPPPANTSTTDNTPAPDPEPEPEPEPPKDPVTLTFHTWWVGGTQGVIDAFTAKYPWITIEANTKIDKAVVNNIVAGETSDLVQLDAGLSPWMAGDLLIDLTPYIEKDETIQNANLPPGFMESFQTGVDPATGKPKQYVLPFSDEPWWMVVNKDLLAKNGLDMPTNDWTWEELLELAKAVTDQNANEWGTLDFGDQHAQILAMANGNADRGRYLNADATKSVLDTPGVHGDMKWIQELTHRWHVQPTAEQKTELGIEGGITAFSQGNFLFMLSADWDLEGLNNISTFEWDVLPTPRGKVRQAAARNPGPMSITQASEHKEEAFMFLSYLFSTEAQKVMIDNGWNAFVTDEDVQAHYDVTEIWQGKPNAPSALRRTSEICCFGADSKTVDFNAYVHNTVARVNAHFVDGSDFSDIIPSVEGYNERIVEMREDLGW